MEQFVWRPRARIVAIVDLVMIVVNILLIAARMHQSGMGVFEHDSENASSGKAYTWLLVISGLITLAVIGLEALAAIKLMMATSIDVDPQKSLKMALCWRSVTTFYAMCTVSACVKGHDYVYLGVHIFYVGICLFVVQKFTAELKDYLESSAGVTIEYSSR